MLSATWYYSTKETSLKFEDYISIAAILSSPAYLTGSTKNAILKRGHQLPGGQKLWPDLWVGTHAVSSEKTGASGDHPALEPRSTRPPQRPADSLRSASAHRPSLPPGPLRLCTSVSAQQVWPSVLALSLPCRDTGPNRARTLLEVCPRPGALLAVGAVTDTLACCSMKGTNAVTGDTGDGQRSPRKHWD